MLRGKKARVSGNENTVLSCPALSCHNIPMPLPPLPLPRRRPLPLFLGISQPSPSLPLLSPPSCRLSTLPRLPHLALPLSPPSLHGIPCSSTAAGSLPLSLIAGSPPPLASTPAGVFRIPMQPIVSSCCASLLRGPTSRSVEYAVHSVYYQREPMKYSTSYIPVAK